MKWLILGSGGMLGRALREMAEASGVALTAWTRSDLDFATPAAGWPALPVGVTHVVNAAAYTDVDGAETDAEHANRINGQALADLSGWCAAAGATLVHYSTDYVFAGNASSPYATDAPRDPLNAYGRSKAIGEAALEAGPASYLCLRTSWLYAPWGNNFVCTMRRLMSQRDALNVVDDQLGRPTSAVHLAEQTRDLLAARVTGMQHACDGGTCSWFEFAGHIARRVGFAGELTPCTSEQFVRPANRPAYSVLDLTRTEAAIGPRPHWTRCLDDALAAEDALSPAVAES
ncbi:MAG: dTDP-4-dehydrorhamnose reductase [Planctomycetota bacterium]